MIPSDLLKLLHLQVFIIELVCFHVIGFLDLSLKMVFSISMPSKFMNTGVWFSLVAPGTLSAQLQHRVFASASDVSPTSRVHLPPEHFAIGAWKLDPINQLHWTSNATKTPGFFLKTNMHIIIIYMNYNFEPF